MLVPYILLLGTWAAIRAVQEVSCWLAQSQSACLGWMAHLKQTKANAVLNKISVAKTSLAKAKIMATKQPGSKP
jgi:hypothetical protein